MQLSVLGTKFLPLGAESWTAYGISPVIMVTFTCRLPVQVDAEGRCQQRSLKYFLGLVHGCWLVSWAWLEACSKAGAWLPETPFQVKGDHMALGAPEKGKTKPPPLPSCICRRGVIVHLCVLL